MKNWKEFELLIAKIQSETAPDAVVRHNLPIVGQSGRRRQMDVTISQKVGLFPVLIVVECKLYKRPVGIEKVEAFASKLKDVQASEGVMISNSGFDEGAISVAKTLAITLLTYKEAQEIDWRVITGSESWIKAYINRHEDISAKAILADKSEILLTFDDSLFDNSGIEFIKAGSVIQDVLDESSKLIPIGVFELSCDVDPPLFIETDSEMQEIIQLVIKGQNSIDEFIINLSLASGDVLTNSSTNKVEYQLVISEPWDWQEIIKSKPSRRISVEEFEEVSRSKNMIPVPATNLNDKRFWRLVLAKKAN